MSKEIGFAGQSGARALLRCGIAGTATLPDCVRIISVKENNQAHLKDTSSQITAAHRGMGLFSQGFREMFLLKQQVPRISWVGHVLHALP